MSNSSFKYSRLAADEDGYIDLQVRPSFLCFFSFKPHLWNIILYLNSVDFLCSFFCLNFTVQKESAKSPVQGNRIGHIPVFDRLLADNLGSSASIRSHRG